MRLAEVEPVGQRVGRRIAEFVMITGQVRAYGVVHADIVMLINDGEKATFLLRCKSL